MIYVVNDIENSVEKSRQFTLIIFLTRIHIGTSLKRKPTLTVNLIILKEYCLCTRIYISESVMA